ncbi:hypothetical protein QBC47DRAFT_69703 [Echria macrotheca]|uniref:Uncharacterized protein n=1 Tax=Echria macrotheca TaxID=438768 RepID=A0AAJ0BAF1_9PEZI|nr:hypothetical protein QBC47DRAFT_69703 [Echria macrotheca]
MTYPPLYDPNLTLTSRRYFTLSSGEPSHHDQQQQHSPSTTRPLETSHGLPPTPAPRFSTDTTSRPTRPRSASSTVSNPPASLPSPVPPTQRSPTWPSPPPKTAATPKLSLQTNTSAATSKHPNGLPTPISPTTAGSKPTTFLVEITNYPALQNARARAQVLSRGDYDAIMLIYDVGSRASFDAIPSLHNEIPSSSLGGRRRNKAVRRSRSSIFGSSSSNHQTPISSYADDSWRPSPVVDDSSLRSRPPPRSASGSGEIVVALVGNKSDFPVDDSSFTSTPNSPVTEEKEAEIQTAEVHARSLVHPLFRQSREFDQDGTMPTSPRSARSMPVGGCPWDYQGSGSDPDHRNSRPPRWSGIETNVRRTRSVTSEGGGGTSGQRISVFSVARRGSLNLVPEEDRRDEQEDNNSTIQNIVSSPAAGAPPTPPHDNDDTEPAAAIQKWLEMDGDGGNGGSHSRTPRTPYEPPPPPSPRERQVSHFEGEMLSRSLLLNVPFIETSARTGSNVEGAFEAVIRQVLHEMGIDVGIPPPPPLPLPPPVAGGTKAEKGSSPTLSRKRSVLQRKEKRDDDQKKRHEISSYESPISDRPPVLTLPGFDDNVDVQPLLDEEANIAIEEDEPLDHQTPQDPPPPVPQPKRRRESALGSFFKKVFTKKPTAMVPDVAA